MHVKEGDNFDVKKIIRNKGLWGQDAAEKCIKRKLRKLFSR